jgi:hypothetical protein
LAWKLSLGAWVFIEMAPTVALRPNKGALRSTEHFDGIHVEEGGEGRAGARDEHPVDVGRDAGVDGGVGVRAEPADAQRDPGLLGDRVDAQVRDHPLQAAHVLHALGLHRLFADRHDRERHVLDVLGALLSGDDDLLDADGVVGFGLGGHGGRRRQERCSRRAPDPRLMSMHSYSPRLDGH